jgi:hypothetical protein
MPTLAAADHDVSRALAPDDLDELMASPEIQELIALTSPRALRGSPGAQTPVTRAAPEPGPMPPSADDQSPGVVERDESHTVPSDSSPRREELARALVARIAPHLVATGMWLATAELRALARIESDRDLLLCTLAVARALAERDEAREDADTVRRQAEADREILVGVDDASDVLPGLAPDRRALTALIENGRIDAWVRRDALEGVPAGVLVDATGAARDAGAA